MRTLDWALSQISGEDAYLPEQVRRLLDVMEYDVPYTAAQIMAAGNEIEGKPAQAVHRPGD